MQAWQVQEPKARPSEALKCAEIEGPQGNAVHGKPVALVTSKAAFDRFTGQQASLLGFMQASPLGELRRGGALRWNGLTTGVARRPW